MRVQTLKGEAVVFVSDEQLSFQSSESAGDLKGEAVVFVIFSVLLSKPFHLFNMTSHNVRPDNVFDFNILTYNSEAIFTDDGSSLYMA